MVRKRFYSLVLPLAALLFTACAESVSGWGPTPPPPPPPPPTWPVNAETFIAGGAGHNDGCNDVAVLWRDGEPMRLESLSPSAFARSVFVDGDDVYVVGERLNPEYILENGWPLHDAVLWKNGEETVLDAPFGCSSWAPSVFVSGGDVYVAGYYERYWISYPIAVIWKNGVMTPLTDPSIVIDDDGYAQWFIWSKAFSVAVSNGNVYVAGFSYGPGAPGGTTAILATVWKNGEILYAVGDCGYHTPFKLFVKGDDVYLASTDNDPRKPQDYGTWPGSVPTVWKNGVATHLGPGNISRADFRQYRMYYVPSSVFVDDDDNVYVTSLRESYNDEHDVVHRSILWVNGEETIMDEMTWLFGVEEPFLVYESKSVASVCVLDGDAYVVGYNKTNATGPLHHAALWVNGEAHSLPSVGGYPYSRASSIFVRDRAK
jgi:hypothetical protein